VRVLFLSGIIILCDQASKLLIKGMRIPWLGVSLDGFQYGATKQIFGDFFRLTYIENPGMAFGIDLGGKLFFSIFSIVASLAILAYLYRARDEKFGFRVSLAMILAGAVGNLIDRVFYGVIFGDAPLFYGKVVDFLDLDFFDFSFLGYHLTRWPVFNIADASVTIGVLLLLFFPRSTEPDNVVTPVASAAGAPYAPPGSAVNTGVNKETPARSADAPQSLRE
jgi:signal peptidase II